LCIVSIMIYTNFDKISWYELRRNDLRIKLEGEDGKTN
jgi:hypothetical protein